MWRTDDARPGNKQQWLNVLLRQGIVMSLARIKQVLTHLEEAKDVVFRLFNMNTSRNGDTAYIVRPITFEPIDKMKVFYWEIHDKYLDSKKGLDKMFSACIAYDGSADGKNVYYLETDNALIQKNMICYWRLWRHSSGTRPAFNESDCFNDYV